MNILRWLKRKHALFRGSLLDLAWLDVDDAQTRYHTAIEHEHGWKRTLYNAKLAGTATIGMIDGYTDASSATTLAYTQLYEAQRVYTHIKKDETP